MEEGSDDRETEEDMSESSNSSLPPPTQESSTSRPTSHLNSAESVSSCSSQVAANITDRAHKPKQKSKDRGDDLEMEKVAILN